MIIISITRFTERLLNDLGEQLTASFCDFKITQVSSKIFHTDLKSLTRSNKGGKSLYRAELGLE